jgi:hypothetical protein
MPTERLPDYMRGAVKHSLIAAPTGGVVGRIG